MKINTKERIIHLCRNNCNGDIVVFTHGLYCSYSSEFMKYIISFLVNKGLVVIAFEFKYFSEKRLPSKNLSREAQELAEVINYVKGKYGHKKIHLLGKSLGGIVNLTYYLTIGGNKVKSLVQLGMPIKLGYPPKPELLKKDNPVLPRYLLEYRNLFRKFDNSRNKFFVIQGTNDDLYDRKMENIVWKKNIFYIKNADHNFIDYKNPKKKYYKECSVQISSILEVLKFSTKKKQ